MEEKIEKEEEGNLGRERQTRTRNKC